MSVSKILLKTLKLISKKGKELERLKKFVHFQKRQEVVGKVFDFLVLQYPIYQVTDEMVWKIIAPNGTKINEAHLRVYYSDLNNLIEQFFIFEQLKKEKALQQALLAKVYNEKGEYERFVDSNEAAQKELTAQATTAQQLSEIVFLKQAIFFHPQSKNLRKEESDLREIIKLVDENHLMMKLKFVVESLSHANIYERKKDFPYLDELVAFAQQSDFQYNIVINAYCYLVQLYQQKNNKCYLDAVGFFEKNESLFEQEDKKAIQLHLQNFLIRESNKGNEEMALVFFEKQQKIFSQQFENDNKAFISEQSFLNLVSAACLANQLDFLDTFIPQNEHRIAIGNKKIILILAKANLSFYKYLNEKNTQYLDDILESTREIETLKGDLNYNLMLRMNICKTYFEYLLINNTQSQPLEDYLKSFEIYLRRKSLSKDKALLYTNFHTQLHKILLVFNNSTLNRKDKNDELNAIKENISKMSVGNKQWLMSKIEQIRNQIS